MATRRELDKLVKGLRLFLEHANPDVLHQAARDAITNLGSYIDVLHGRGAR